MLFVRNDPTAPEALLGEVFAESGFDVDTFDVLSPDRPDDPVVDVEFPDPTDYAAIVPLGARWAVYDNRLPWIAAEQAMLRTALSAGAGVLGVCFGGQLLATTLGGEVDRSADPEIGWHDVHSDPDGPVPGGPWFQWHFDRIAAIPPGATEVARNHRATQGFVLGRAVGVQFHPELDDALLELWIAEDRDGEISGLGLRAEDLRAQTSAHLDDAVRRLRLLVGGFLSLAQDPQHGPLRLG